MNKDTLEGEDIIMIEVEGHQDRRNDQERGYLRSGKLPDRGSPNDGGPPDDGGPPMMEDPGKWKTSEMTWKTRTTRPTRTSWTTASYYSTTTPGYIGYYSFGKYFWYSWPVNVEIG